MERSVLALAAIGWKSEQTRHRRWDVIPLVAYSGAVAGWTVTALLTLAMIVLPLLYLFALTFMTDDEAIERAVRDEVQYVELEARADAYAYGKDFYGVLATPLEVAPLAATRSGARVGT
jgi:hypothetical protein